jgi:hypothetical protein
MGPITNAIGMHLTAVSVHRSVISQPNPWGDVRGDTPLDQCSRGMAASVDETGLLWLCEKLIPHTDFLPREAGLRFQRSERRHAISCLHNHFESLPGPRKRLAALLALHASCCWPFSPTWERRRTRCLISVSNWPRRGQLSEKWPLCLGTYNYRAMLVNRDRCNW